MEGNNKLMKLRILNCMNVEKKIRQIIGLICAIITYYIIHEGAHYLVAPYFKVFKEIKFLGLGIQIDVFVEKMSKYQMAIFCLAGVIATIIAATILIAFTNKICNLKNKIVKTYFYYTTMIMLFLDPIYLGVLYKLFGGGDMNGIKLIFPEIYVQITFITLFVVAIYIYVIYILHKYKKSFI